MNEPAYRVRLREATRADWRFMLGIGPGDFFLDAQSDDGRLGRSLQPWARSFHRVRCDAGTNDVVSLDAGQADAPVAGFDWVFLGRSGVAGRTPGRALPDAVARWVRPGGHLAIMLENPRGLHWLADWRPALAGSPAVEGALRGTRATWAGYMREAGLAELCTFALLPHHEAPRAVIPLDPACPAGGERLALEQVWQRASPGAALARHVLGALIRVGAMRALYPHYLLLGRRPC